MLVLLFRGGEKDFPLCFMHCFEIFVDALSCLRLCASAPIRYADAAARRFDVPFYAAALRVCYDEERLQAHTPYLRHAYDTITIRQLRLPPISIMRHTA